MPVYLINSYDIIDAAVFQNYPPRVLPILEKYGAKVLASDTTAIVYGFHHQYQYVCGNKNNRKL